MIRDSIDYDFLYSLIPMYVEGGQLTLFLTVVCNSLSIFTGYIFATVLYFRIPVLRQLVRFYVSFIRNTPLLVQLFFFYFGMPEVGVRTDSLTSGMIALTVWATAYQTETIRGAIDGLPRGLTESGRSLGLRPVHLFVFVVVPVATRTVIPAMLNTIVSVTKNSSLLSAIGVPELTFVAMDNIAETYRAMENFVALLIGYLALVLPLSASVGRLEKSLARGYRR